MPTFELGALVRSRALGDQGMIRADRGSDWHEVFFQRIGIRTVHASDLIPVAENRLIEALKGDELDNPLEFLLRHQALELSLAHQHDPHASLSSSRLEPQAHQIVVAHKAVSSALHPRLLLADDVGLGKTIEAGLIIKELKARGLAERILIIAPASLTTQWERELRVKFNESFLRVTREREALMEAEVPESNPYSRAKQVILTLPFARREKRVERLTEVEWDLIIVDEAHHLRAYRDRSTTAYQLAQKLSERTRGLLLLTATPLQLDLYEFYSLLQLLDASVVGDYDSFVAHQDSRRDLNLLLGQVQLYHQSSESEQTATVRTALARITEVIGPDGYANLFAKDQANPALSAEEALEILLGTEAGRDRVRDLLIQLDPVACNDRISALMIRNRRRIIQGFSLRQARTIPVRYTPAETKVYDGMQAFIRAGYSRSKEQGDQNLGFLMVIFQRLLTSSPAALASALERRIERVSPGGMAALAPNHLLDSLDPDDWEEPEEWDRIVDDLVNATETGHQEGTVLARFLKLVWALPLDSKLVALEQMLAEQIPKAGKVLIFTQFRKTAEYLEEKLSRLYRTTTFHGGMSAEQKDAAAETFRSSAQVMIATEAAQEGRNFQFCNIVINYDLPWNPIRIEQRIGRVDRIGQTRDVFIYNFTVPGTVEDRVLELLQKRIRIFDEAIGGLDGVLGDLEKEIQELLMLQRDQFDQEIERLGITYEEKLRRAKEVDELRQDFLLDRSSFRWDTHEEIMQRKRSVTQADAKSFLEAYFGQFGTYKALKDGRVEIEEPARWMYQDHRGHRNQVLGTCDLKLAIQQEQLQFFAFGQREFDRAIAHCRSEEFPGRVSSLTVRAQELYGNVYLRLEAVLTYQGLRSVEQQVSFLIDLFEPGRSVGEEAEVLAIQPESEPGPLLDAGLSDRLEAAWSAGEERLVSLADAGRDRAQAMNDQLISLERTRLLRLYDYQVERAKARLAEAEEKVRHMERFGTDSERRILPIYRSEVQKARESLEAITQDRDKAMAHIDASTRVAPQFRIEAAALVSVSL